MYRDQANTQWYNSITYWQKVTRNKILLISMHMSNSINTEHKQKCYGQNQGQPENSLIIILPPILFITHTRGINKYLCIAKFVKEFWLCPLHSFFFFFALPITLSFFALPITLSFLALPTILFFGFAHYTLFFGFAHYTLFFGFGPLHSLFWLLPITLSFFFSFLWNFDAWSH